jgi:tetratricopeptide (TPR) repeat protein
MVLLRNALAASIAVGCAGQALAAGQFVEDVRVSRRGDEATITIDLACPMRFRSDVVTPEGVLLEIRVSPLDDCRQLGFGDSIMSETYRPPGGQIAHLLEVEYESLGLGDNLVILKFDRSVGYRISQRGDLRTLELRVNLATAGPPAAPVTVEPAPAPATAPRTAPSSTLPDRAPLTARLREPSTLQDYVLNLVSTREPVDPVAVSSVTVAPERHLYVSTTEVAGVTWYRLRLGFFASEAEARGALDGLVASFPRAWVGRAEADEVRQAAQLEVERGGVIETKPEQVAATSSVAGAALSPARIEELEAEGRAAIVSGDFATAIRVYTRLLEAPGDHRPEARENLGLAREKNGQTAHAAAEYRRYLADYPDGEGAERVQQRLSGLVTAAAAPRERLRRETRAERRWDVTSGLSQYYRRDVNRFGEDLPEVVTLSAVLTDLDLSVRHRGDAVDMLGRVAINHLYDLVGEEQGGPGDRSRIAHAYFDVSGSEDNWSVRLGRQSLHNWGVLGRFDGLHGTYSWAPERRLHFVTGYPVERTSASLETDREFMGVAVDFDQLVGNWDFSPFVTSQTIDGIEDRKAAGLEVRYFDDRRSLTTMLDYDTGFGELNTALLFGTWRLKNRLTLTALYDDRLSPILTTRNALIGQPVSTVDELLLVLTEDEVRQLALDRTVTSRTATLGIAAPISERWQLNADLTMSEIGSSVESFGVPAIPGTGSQTFVSTTFVGSALFGGNDVSIFNLRYGESDEFTLSQLTWDMRIPVGRRLRINPRLRLGIWEGTTTQRRRETIRPSLRLLLNLQRHYHLELEVGSDNFTRTDRGTEQKGTGQFLYLGYRADF